MRTPPGLLWLSCALTLYGCAPTEVVNPIADQFPGNGGKSDASRLATILDFEWDGELEAGAFDGNESAAKSLLYYTVGQLNGANSVGRMDRAEFSDFKATPIKDGRRRITYHAKMPVAWGSKTNLPKSFAFKLPRRVDQFGEFTLKYRDTCAEHHDDDPITADAMWYYYRPDLTGCRFDDGDTVTSTAKITVSPVNTTEKYPEYDKVWEDGELRVVAVFGKFEKGKQTIAEDIGIWAFDDFKERIARLAGADKIEGDDVRYEKELAPGKKLIVNILLVDEISSATEAFYARYEELSTRADFIAYNGHAGLGANIRTLAQKGRFVAGQYVIIFMNGCDTYTYVDGALATTRAAINPDDPTGTKYMDFILNAMPEFFVNEPAATMAIIRGLMRYDAPITYETMFDDISSSQVVLVSGEEDNLFKP